MIRLAICWPQVTGYMAACWRALARHDDLSLLILAGRGSDQNPLPAELTADLPCRLLTQEQQRDAGHVAQLVLAHRPDAVYVGGWAVRGYTPLAFNPGLAGAAIFCGMDTPRRRSLRQWLARAALRRLLQRVDRMFVAGRRAHDYARWLGLPEDRIVPGLYGFDDARFAPTFDRRCKRPGGWPKGFLYAGRYLSAVKGLDLLVNAYERYRVEVEQPWPLITCGAGPQARMLAGVKGIEDRGFVQPGDLPGVFEEAGVFVLPSRYEPWGVVLAEAAASGLPILCTDACGAADEVVEHRKTGLIMPANDSAGLALGLAWMHDRHGQLARMGEAGRALAAPFGAATWADRWHAALCEVCGGGE
jgi:glycosyltransferase involved in cell wall biosynthesis